MQVPRKHKLCDSFLYGIDGQNALCYKMVFCGGMWFCGYGSLPFSKKVLNVEGRVVISDTTFTESIHIHFVLALQPS